MSVVQPGVALVSMIHTPEGGHGDEVCAAAGNRVGVHAVAETMLLLEGMLMTVICADTGDQIEDYDLSFCSGINDHRQ